MARRVPSTRVKVGRHAEHVGYRDDGYVECRKCGFICHLDRDSRAGRGNGIAFTVTSYWGDGAWGNEVWGGGSVSTLNDPTVTGGCPLCGTLNYQESNNGR